MPGVELDDAHVLDERLAVVMQQPLFTRRCLLEPQLALAHALAVRKGAPKGGARDGGATA
jgi:hypothetical protein